jgi:hypothetical protein
MINRTPQILAVCIILALTAVGYALWGRGEQSNHQDLALTLNAAFSDQGPAADGNQSDPSQSASALNLSSSAKDFQTYTDSRYNFSFQHPADFHLSALEESSGTMILAEGSSSERVFQIFIQPLAATGTLTPQDIKRELPDKKLDNPTPIVLADDTPALMFLSEEAGQSTREVWLVRNNHLFQIRAPLTFDAELSRIMSTWTFQ